MSLEKGNAYFAQGHFRKAINAYNPEISLLGFNSSLRLYNIALSFQNMDIKDSSILFFKRSIQANESKKKEATEVILIMYDPYITELEETLLEEADIVFCNLSIGRLFDLENELKKARWHYVLAQKAAEKCLLRSTACQEQLTEVRRLLRSVRKRMAAKGTIKNF